MTSVDITVLSTEEVCRLLGIEERRLKQLIRDRVLIEARGDDGVRGVPQKSSSRVRTAGNRFRSCRAR